MGSAVNSLVSRVQTWIDTYPLSFLPSLEQLSAARPRVPRPAPQDPFQSGSSCSVAQAEDTDTATFHGKRPYACLDAGGLSASERVDAAQADEQEAAEVIDAAHSSTAPTQPMEESGYSKRKRKGRKARQRAKARLAASAEVTATVELPSSARPQTPLPPRSLLPALPSRPNLPVFLSSDLLFPDLSRLRITHFDAFLRRPVEPAWSAPMYECILRFLLSRAPAERWHPDPARLAAGDQLPSIAQEIRARQPNEQAIRACFQPRDAPGFDTLTAAMQAKFYAMQLVMRWMWGDATLNVHAVTDLVQRAPLALHILVREFSSSVRLFDLVETSERNLRLYLSSLALPTPFQQAAIRLLDWLNTPAEPNRHYLFFCTPEGALRSERPWEWWDALAETQGGARTKDLDNWEKTLLARERWGT